MNSATAWTKRHAATAISQGWGLFLSNHGLEIERDDAANVFMGDEEALAFVKAQAARGEAAAVDALHVLFVASRQDRYDRWYDKVRSAPNMTVSIHSGDLFSSGLQDALRRRAKKDDLDLSIMGPHEGARDASAWTVTLTDRGPRGTIQTTRTAMQRPRDEPEHERTLSSPVDPKWHGHR